MTPNDEIKESIVIKNEFIISLQCSENLYKNIYESLDEIFKKNEWTLGAFRNKDSLIDYDTSEQFYFKENGDVANITLGVIYSSNIKDDHTLFLKICFNNPNSSIIGEIIKELEGNLQ